MLSYESVSTADDQEAVYRVLVEAFGRDDPDGPLFVRHHGRERMRMVRRDGIIVAGTQLLPLEHWFGGRTVGGIGYNGVASAPEARGCGAGSLLMSETLAEIERAGAALASLYSANNRFYESVGFACAGLNARRRVSTDAIPRLRSSLTAVRVTGDAEAVAAALEPIADRRGARSNGVVRRDSMLWERVLSADAPAIAFIFQRDPADRATAEGYAIVGYKGLFGRVVAADLCFLSAEAVRAALVLLGGYGSNPESVDYAMLPGDPVLAAIGAWDAEFVVHEAFMLRIVNLPAALRSRGYPPELACELELEVSDPVLESNRGRWRLTVENGVASVTPGGDGKVRLDVTTLAPLYSGWQHPLDPVLDGRLEASAQDRWKLAALFSGPAPFSVDFY